MIFDFLNLIWTVSGGVVGILIALFVSKMVPQKERHNEDAIDVELLRAKNDGLIYRAIIIVTAGLAGSVVTLAIMGKEVPSEIVLQLGVLLGGLFAHVNKTEPVTGTGTGNGNGTGTGNGNGNGKEHNGNGKSVTSG